MAQDKKTKKEAATTNTLFDKENFKWMLVGIVVIVIGYFLMSGGNSDNPNVFNGKEIYSFRRITLAPFLIVLGFVIEIFAIMKKSKKTS
ncbi:MAG: DUF3098 domain-containing protein [Bacteroidetes bacterium]|nr:DUF3098 domain-containing protein [Bacteroidota bacterium]MBS1758407.1 DUF3098 domain-containing protein [Bacteroidota bacterium]